MGRVSVCRRNRPSRWISRFVQQGILQAILLSMGLIYFCVGLVYFCEGALRPEIGAEAAGMGGAWTSQAEGAMALFWNPAGLGRLESGMLSYDLSQGALAVATPIPRLGTLGLGILDLNGADRFLFNTPANPLGTFETGYNQILLSYARPITARFLLGGNFGVSRTPHDGSQWQAGYDLGFLLRLTRDTWLGVRSNDIGGTRIRNAEGLLLEEFSQRFTLGLMWARLSWFRLSGDIDTAQWQWRIGTQVGPSWLQFRLGVIADLDMPRSPFRWTSGLSIRYHDFELSYAYRDATEAPHRLSFQWAFTQPPRSVAVDASPSNLELPPLETAASPSKRPGSSVRPAKPPTSQPPPRVLPTPLKSGAAGVPAKRPEIVVQLEPIPGIQGPQGAANKTSQESPTIRLARQYGVEVEMILALVRAESNFEPEAISPAGAVGLTQLMPDTARALGLQVPSYRNVKRPTRDPHEDERFNARKNLVAGLAYLRALLDAYEGNYVLAISAYNAGPARVSQHVPDIRQTEKHVGRVMNYYYQYKNSATAREEAIARLDRVLLAPGGGR